MVVDRFLPPMLPQPTYPKWDSEHTAQQFRFLQFASYIPAEVPAGSLPEVNGSLYYHLDSSGTVASLRRDKLSMDMWE